MGKDHIVLHENLVNKKEKSRMNKHNSGIIKNYIGVSSPYEEPEKPEMMLATDRLSIDESVKNILKHLSNNKCIKVADVC